jgi:hypothetical protein
MEIATFLPKAAGHFCLLFYWLMGIIWAVPSGFPISFKNCPVAFGHFQAAFIFLSAVPSSCPIALTLIRMAGVVYDSQNFEQTQLKMA